MDESRRMNVAVNMVCYILKYCCAPALVKRFGACEVGGERKTIRIKTVGLDTDLESDAERAV